MKNLFTIIIFISFIGNSSFIYSQSSLYFGGTDAYITFGVAPNLGLSQFTLECWFMRQGSGISAYTGIGGVTAIPLITKGMHEQDGNTTDMNYFLGIQATDNKLCADFEEGATGTTPGLNHPVVGTTAIALNTWYHAAVTYDGTTWNIYLNGNLETSLTVGQPVQNKSIQHAGIATAINSTGVNEGYFDGIIDEVRIWNKALTVDEIISNLHKKITSPTSNLQARWGFDEGKDTIINDNSGNNITGTIKGTNYSWSTQEVPIDYKTPPAIHSISNENSFANCSVSNVVLNTQIVDTKKDTLTVEYFEKPVQSSTSKKFTIIGLPDTQFYTAEEWGGQFSFFKSQTNWIVSQKNNLNIKFVAQYGDLTDHNINLEWQRADTAMKILEDTVTTGLTDGIPFITCVGNHDQIGETTAPYNQYFGKSRFVGRNYYGGNYGSTNNNQFDFFENDDLKFIVVSLDYSLNPDTTILNWADSLLKKYSDYYAIILSHYILNVDGTFGNQGQITYNTLKNNPNLFLMLCGHMDGESMQTDVYNENTVYSILSDYQGIKNGGNGYLRIMEIDPTQNKINIKTYSPVLDTYQTDANNEFSLPYTFMNLNVPYQKIGQTTTIAPGESSISLNIFDQNKTYNWYSKVTDKNSTVYSPLGTFTTTPIKVIISLQNDTLFSNVDKGNQWYDKNGIINGKTDNYFKPSQNGTYFSIVSQNGNVCDTSNMITINSIKLGIQNKPVQNIQIFPNPVKNKITVSFENSDDKYILEINDATGRKIFSNQINSKGNYTEQVDISDSPAGIYILQLRSDKNIILKKFIKQ